VAQNCGGADHLCEKCVEDVILKDVNQVIHIPTSKRILLMMHVWQPHGLRRLIKQKLVRVI
jgi:hypothetical protein